MASYNFDACFPAIGIGGLDEKRCKSDGGGELEVAPLKASYDLTMKGKPLPSMEGAVCRIMSTRDGGTRCVET
jgi:hypothetical protein